MRAVSSTPPISSSTTSRNTNTFSMAGTVGVTVLGIDNLSVTFGDCNANQADRSWRCITGSSSTTVR